MKVSVNDRLNWLTLGKIIEINFMRVSNYRVIISKEVFVFLMSLRLHQK